MRTAYDVPANYPATITFQPGMRNGAPTIGGTRMPLDTVLNAMWHGGIDYACEGWDVSREQCLVAAWFAGLYGISTLPHDSGRMRGREWIRRYGDWARQHGGTLWSTGGFHRVPDPPTCDREGRP